MLPCVRTCCECFWWIVSYIPTVLCTILQVGKLRQRDISFVAWSHMACKQYNWDCSLAFWLQNSCAYHSYTTQSTRKPSLGSQSSQGCPRETWISHTWWEFCRELVTLWLADKLRQGSCFYLLGYLLDNFWSKCEYQPQFMLVSPWGL